MTKSEVLDVRMLQHRGPPVPTLEPQVYCMTKLILSSNSYCQQFDSRCMCNCCVRLQFATRVLNLFFRDPIVSHFRPCNLLILLISLKIKDIVYCIIEIGLCLYSVVLLHVAFEQAYVFWTPGMPLKLFFSHDNNLFNVFFIWSKYLVSWFIVSMVLC